MVTNVIVKPYQNLIVMLGLEILKKKTLLFGKVFSTLRKNLFYKKYFLNQAESIFLFELLKLSW